MLAERLIPGGYRKVPDDDQAFFVYIPEFDSLLLADR